jgi:hypothetical protein
MRFTGTSRHSLAQLSGCNPLGVYWGTNSAASVNLPAREVLELGAELGDMLRD